MPRVITKKNKLALFFNSNRGFNLLKILKKNFLVDIYLCKKNLNKNTKSKLKGIKYSLISKIDKKLISKIKMRKYYLIISAGCPYIFPQELINSAKKKVINLHAGPLPGYRGGSPLNWQMINGVKYIGVSVIKMSKGLDSGPIYEKAKFKLKDEYNIYDVHQRVNKIFSILTIKAIGKIQKNINPSPQSSKKIKIYKQRTDKDGLINWKKLNAKEVYNFVRAISKPYPGAYFYKKGKKVRLFKCKKSRLNPNLEPGTKFIDKGKKYIKCKKFSIQF